MKEELRMVLSEIASHPATYGISAAIARWAIGDRSGGWKAFATYVGTSVFVAWIASIWFIDEQLTSGRRGVYIVLFAFAAKDVLMGLAFLGTQFATNPLDILRRIRRAFNGGPDA